MNEKEGFILVSELPDDRPVFTPKVENKSFSQGISEIHDLCHDNCVLDGTTDCNDKCGLMNT